MLLYSNILIALVRHTLPIIIETNTVINTVNLAATVYNDIGSAARDVTNCNH